MSSPSPSTSSISGQSVDLPPPSSNHAGLTASHSNWASIKAETLIRGQVLVELDARTHLHEACKRLMDAGVSSVPVFDPDTKTYVGMFDYADFLTYFLIVLHRTSLLSSEEAQNLNDDDQLAKAVGQAAAQQDMPVRNVSDISHRNPFYSCIPQTTLGQVVDILSKGIHRLVIMDDGVKARGILSQLTVVKYFTEHIFQLPSLEGIVSQSLEELHLGIDKKVVTISIEKLVLEALTTMSSNDVYSLAVVDKEGRLAGNFSLSDVKHLMKTDRRRLLNTTLRDFISRVKLEQGIEAGQDTVLVFQVHAKHTLRLVMAKIVATKAHRMWVTDESGQVIGVVTLTDILRVISDDQAKREG
ncbi:hypothetical protein BJ684DRAFT_19009 [Piptocephalis cylindrospora]|uniref:CBS domain-containing protein n=1 Tax=Piptocephalis cylindrospora TaxID=1907219 RepID=A0A4V1IYH7_9FUNG|nr:hypothetical protein BJ684DRAFT_19009 [Piptocephalis cylindrospora]|eukprot:RKP14599.1 hypothetical protein BJ684DRAFT_19009 [Piptocephalis cylindrospora]